MSKTTFLNVDELLDHLFRHVRRFVTLNLLLSYFRSVVVAFLWEANEDKSNSGGYENLGAKICINSVAL